MARPYDRPATLVALVNALVVMLLPVALMSLVALFAKDYSDGGTRVVGSLPAAEHYTRLAQAVAAYVLTLSPFATAAAARTFVHAKNWLHSGETGWIGVLEGGLCGFGGACLVLLPGLVTHSPARGLPLLIVYGGVTFILGLAVGVVLWCTATVALHIVPRWRSAQANDADNGARPLEGPQ